MCGFCGQAGHARGTQACALGRAFSGRGQLLVVDNAATAFDQLPQEVRVVGMRRGNAMRGTAVRVFPVRVFPLRWAPWLAWAGTLAALGGHLGWPGWAPGLAWVGTLAGLLTLGRPMLTHCHRTQILALNVQPALKLPKDAVYAVAVLTGNHAAAAGGPSSPARLVQIQLFGKGQGPSEGGLGSGGVWVHEAALLSWCKDGKATTKWLFVARVGAEQ